MNKQFKALLIASLLLPLLATAEPLTRAELPQLVAECERQRMENLAPLREAEILECVDKGRGDRAYCERFNSDFGEVIHLAGGGTRPGLFYELPVCEQAFDAERFFNMYPGEDTYAEE